MFSNPVYDLKKETLDLNINKIDIEDVTLSDSIKIPGFLIGLIINSVKDELNKGILENLEKVKLYKITPTITLPDVPNEPNNHIQVLFRNIIAVNESTMALEINLERLKRKDYNKPFPDFSKKPA